ncbi:hypothetical protein MUN89_07605 [Halobacillus salinarum]|uniref:Uncharacterized protein n=1 Tax=Halobacillus salinarum TaxID=2932257 RepID=A0ABY4EP72_9BACI|nr:hypothetical protein [Halobacillus salinarum]UOQ45785.1 hypothetical protein MUN89_07605 [Halobacillus salinarum]
MKPERIFSLLSLIFIVCAYLTYPIVLFPDALMIAGINLSIAGWRSLAMDKDKWGYFYGILANIFASYGLLKFFA